MCSVEFTGHLLSDRDTTSSTGMGEGENGNNQWEWEGNGNKARLNLGLGLGMGMTINHWEWEGMGLKKIFPLISSVVDGECRSAKIYFGGISFPQMMSGQGGTVIQ